MNTWFEISLAHVDEPYARQAATEAFVEIDRLENILSRFREGSDIDILNKRGGVEPVQVTEECWDCLLQAMDLELLTNGLFSVAFESFMTDSPAQGILPPAGWIEMDANRRTVFLRETGMTLDLGGIGKGFALDLVVKLLEDWDVQSLLIHAGTSTAVARGSRSEVGGWPATVSLEMGPREVCLRDASLSGSSLLVQGAHILDLKKTEVLDTERRTWAWAPGGALSDGLSTSFMLMNIEEIEAVCEQLDGVGAWILDPNTGSQAHSFDVAPTLFPEPEA